MVYGMQVEMAMTRSVFHAAREIQSEIETAAREKMLTGQEKGKNAAERILGACNLHRKESWAGLPRKHP